MKILWVAIKWIFKALGGVLWGLLYFIQALLLTNPVGSREFDPYFDRKQRKKEETFKKQALEKEKKKEDAFLKGIINE